MKIVFVCRGNTCRSPMAMAIAQRKFADSGYGAVEVESAGLEAMVGHQAHENALLVAQENGLDLSAHRGRQLDEELLSSADLVVVMDKWLEKRVRDNFRAKPEIICRDVNDPYSPDPAPYRVAWKEIEGMVEDLLAEREWQRPESPV